MRHILSAICFFLGTTALHAQTVTVDTARGPVEVESNPQTVVTMDLAVLDTIDRIGGDVAGVPNGVKPDYLMKYSGDDYTVIGTFFEPDIEAIAALQPDLIIVGGRSSARFDELSRLAPTIDLTADPAKLLTDVHRNTRAVGAIFDQMDVAEQVLGDMDAKIASLNARSRDAGRALTVMTTGGRMSTYGPDGRFALLYDAFGFDPALEAMEAGTHGQPISNEFIRSNDPDWLFVIDRDAAVGDEGQPAAQMLDNPLVNDTNAAKSGNVVYLDPIDWYLVGASVTAVENSADEIAEALAK